MAEEQQPQPLPDPEEEKIQRLFQDANKCVDMLREDITVLANRLYPEQGRGCFIFDFKSLDHFWDVMEGKVGNMQENGNVDITSMLKYVSVMDLGSFREVTSLEQAIKMYSPLRQFVVLYVVRHREDSMSAHVQTVDKSPPAVEREKVRQDIVTLLQRVTVGTPSWEVLKTTCVNCRQGQRFVYPCPKCGIFFFCSMKCEADYEKEHAFQCKFIQDSFALLLEARKSKAAT